MLRTTILAAASSLVFTSLTTAALIVPGPISYIYDADSGQDAGDETAALDGSWNHDSGSDAWDGSSPVPGDGAPGGAFVERETIGLVLPNSPIERPQVLTIVDPGDPRDAGFPDPSNRKIHLSRAISDLDFAGAGSYVVARWRMDPDPPEANSDGSISDSYTLHDNIGQINLGNGTNSLSISYQSATELAVEVGGSDDFELIDIGSSFDFHTVLATMADNGDGTFAVTVNVDGEDKLSLPAAALPREHSGGGITDPGISIGLGSTGRAGAIQVDFIGAGLVPEPSSFGLLAFALGAFALNRRRR